MPCIHFSDLRANLSAHLDRVEADRTELVVTRHRHEPVVILALSEWESMKETLHVLGNPANAAHLRASLASLETGDVAEHDLVETGR